MTTTAIQRHAAAPVATTTETFPDLCKMGEQLVKTGFLPAHIRTGVQFAAIVITGRELGMQTMRAVRSLQMVKGKVLESADSQLARFKADGGRAVFKVLTDEEAVLWLKHPNGDEHTETWTKDDTRRAGLGGNHNTFPKAMNRSRAITAGLKSLGWEGGVGAYDPDELRPAPEHEEPQHEEQATGEPQVLDPEPTPTRPPPVASKPLRPAHARLVDWRERLAGASEEAAVAMREEVRELAAGSLKISSAMDLAIDRRLCELHEVAHDPDERGMKALAWLDSLGGAA
jgi:hypothetical protein